MTSKEGFASRALFVTISIFTISVYAPIAEAVDCRSMMVDYHQWLARDESHRFIQVDMVSAKVRNPNPAAGYGHSSYGYGMARTRGSQLWAPMFVSFSDRRAASDRHQLFDRNQVDEQEIIIDTHSLNVDIILRSWGDARHSLENVQCPSDGFITGLKRESNGISYVTIMLIKQTEAAARR